MAADVAQLEINPTFQLLERERERERQIYIYTDSLVDLVKSKS